MCAKLNENSCCGFEDFYMFICDRQTEQQATRQMPDNHILICKTFLIFEKIPLPGPPFSLLKFALFAGGGGNFWIITNTF